MAITNIVSGALKNKVGAMVGAKWKGRSYVRAYVVPKNPRTEAQVAVRTGFKDLTDFGRLINTTVLKKYIKAKPKNMTEINRFVQLNKALLVESPQLENAQIATGSLMKPTAVSPTLSATGPNTIEVTVPETITYEGETLLVVVQYDKSNQFALVYTRELDGSGTYTITAQATLPPSAETFVYAFLYNATLGNSNTIGVTDTVA